MTPQQVDDMACSELDALFEISQTFNKKRNDELEINKQKQIAKRR